MSASAEARATERTLAASVPVFAALGETTRLHLLARLGTEGPLSIARLTDGTRLTRQAVTKHLRVLQVAGLARGARRGREQVWQIQPAPLLKARRSLEAVSARWDEALERLRALVEE
jgi:DNA-binding transcriptional ArsR family regulator